MKALKLLYIDKKWIEEECDISKIPIERVEKIIKDLVEINEAIAELEALQQPKSCEGCKYLYINKHSEFVEYCTDLNIEIPYSGITTFCCNRYEPKE